MTKRRRPNLARSTSAAQKMKQLRASQTSEERERSNETERLRVGRYRASETQQQHESRISAQRSRTVQSRASETQEQYDSRLSVQRLRAVQSRASETQEQRTARNAANRARAATARRTAHVDLNQVAFRYDANYDYSLHPSVDIGKMSKLCIAINHKNHQ